MKKLAAVLALILIATTGCMKQKITIGDGAKQSSANKIEEHWVLSWGPGGVIGTARTSASCPSGNATIVTSRTAANVLVQGLLFGGLVLVPSKISIWCESGAKAEIQLTPKQMQAVVMSPEFLHYVEETAPEQADAVRAAQTEAKRQAEAAASNDKN